MVVKLNNHQNKLVSVGMPVFNGEKTLSDAIRSILNQTYRNIELIVSDNNSTDRSLEIIRKFAAQDKRIRLITSEENNGGAWNFNKVFQCSSGQYFMWASHDDLRDLNFISECVGMLERNEKAVLCQAKTYVVPIENPQSVTYEADLSSFEDKYSLESRYKETYRNFPATAIYGLYRSSALAKTHLFSNCVGSDLAFIQELSVYGAFIWTDEVKFIYQYRQTWNNKKQDFSFFKGKGVRPFFHFPFLLIFIEHFKRILLCKLDWKKKILVMKCLFLCESHRLFLQLVQVILLVFLPKRIKYLIAELFYWRCLHSPNLTVVDMESFKKRIISPRMRLQDEQGG